LPQQRLVIRAENEIVLTSSEAEQNASIFIGQSEVSIAAGRGCDYLFKKQAIIKTQSATNF